MRARADPALADPGSGAALLRAAREPDTADIIELIAAAYAEYPGCVLDIEVDMPEPKAPPVAMRRGAFDGPVNATSTMPASASNSASARTSRPARFSNPRPNPLGISEAFSLTRGIAL